VRTSDALLNFAMLLANIYGLMLVVAFMSYGIVDIPRRLWYKSDHTFQTRYVQFKVPAYREDYEEAEDNLRDVYRVRPNRGATSTRKLATANLTRTVPEARVDDFRAHRRSTGRTARCRRAATTASGWTSSSPRYATAVFMVVAWFLPTPNRVVVALRVHAGAGRVLRRGRRGTRGGGRGQR